MSVEIKPFAEAPFAEGYGQMNLYEFVDTPPPPVQKPLATPDSGESLMLDVRARMDLLRGRSIIEAEYHECDGVIEMKLDNGDVLLLPASPRTPQLLWKWKR